MRTATSIGLLASLFFLSVGCTGDSSSGATEAEKAAAPLRGSELGKASELVGVWIALTEADFEVIEFMKDGKALAGGESGGLTVDYTVLEGGRLSLAALGGTTMVFETTIAGDQLELRGKASLLSVGGTQRFRRLAKGETIESAKKKMREEEAKAYQDRAAALEAFLKQPGLVLSVAEPSAAAPPAIALEITTTAGSFSGKAWHDDRPPHVDAISGQIVLEPKKGSTQVTISFGQRIAPPLPGPQAGAGQITLIGTGSGSGFKLSNKVTYGQGATFDMSLRADPKLHAEVVKRFEAEIARVEALKAPIVSLLKDHAVLKGQLQPAAQNQPRPDSVEIVLVRDAKSGQYRCEGLLIGARERGELIANAAAEVVVVNDRPLLRVVCPPMRQLFLKAADGNAKTLSGEWQMMGQSPGKGAQLEVVSAIDNAARDALLETKRNALKAIGTDAVFTGLAFEDSPLGLEMPISMRLQITLNPDGAVTGKAEYPSMATVMTVGGQIAESLAGPRLQLNFTGSEATQPDKIFLGSIQRGSWILSPGDGSGPLQLKGYFAGPAVRVATLTRVTDESKAQLRKKLAEAMSGDGRFYLARNTGWQIAGQPPTVVEWRLDDATNKITGRVVTGGRPLEAFEKAVTTYAGDLKDENGWLVVYLEQTTQLKANDKAVTNLERFRANEDANGMFYLSGTPTALGRISNGNPVGTPKRNYPVDFIPVAATSAETHAAIDKAVAEMEKAKADAAAQVKSQQDAADTARRAKFAPYAAPFQAKSGAVITTDLPAEMASLILEAQVDEEKSAMSGKGIDLREFPFRDFTFQGALDPRGQLSLTTSLGTTPLLFNAATDKGLTYGRSSALTILADDQRAKLTQLVELGKRLAGAPPRTLSVEILNAATAKTREAALQASDIPGICIYQKKKSDQVAAMFTVKANGRFRWTNEPIVLRLNEPLKGKAIYIKGGLGPTDNLTVVINGVHTAAIATMERTGGAVVALPPDLEILDLQLKAGGTAQARGVVLLK